MQRVTTTIELPIDVCGIIYPNFVLKFKEETLAQDILFNLYVREVEYNLVDNLITVTGDIKWL